MSSSELWVLLANLVVLGVPFSLAWAWGAGPERISASTFLAAMAADVLYHWAVGRRTIYESVDLGHLVIGVSVLAVLFFVALKANRFYPLWLSSLQMLVVLSHFAREASTRVAELAYAILTYGPYFLQIVILTCGIVLHRLRVRRGDPCPSWRGSLDSRVVPMN